MNRYVIIGGDGFVGNVLCKNFEQQNNDFVVVDVKNTCNQKNFVHVDIRDKEQVKKIKINSDDIVIHLAANQYHLKPPKIGRKKYFFETNVDGTRNILQEMALNGCQKMVYLSTDMVYGLPKFLPVTTDHVKQPFGYYGASKYASEKLCDEFRKKGINITIFRPRMIIGPGRLGILTKLFKLIDKNFPVPLIGNGKNCYQMVSVFDVVDAIILAIQNNFPNKEYNLGSKNPPQVKELLLSLIKECRSKSFLIPTPGTVVKIILNLISCFGIEVMYKEQYKIADVDYLLDTSSTEKDLGWNPKFNDTDMMKEAYQEFLEKYKE